jgi:hypothetical protein
LAKKIFFAPTQKLIWNSQKRILNPGPAATSKYFHGDRSLVGLTAPIPSQNFNYCQLSKKVVASFLTATKANSVGPRKRSDRSNVVAKSDPHWKVTKLLNVSSCLKGGTSSVGPKERSDCSNVVAKGDSNLEN